MTHASSLIKEFTSNDLESEILEKVATSNTSCGDDDKRLPSPSLPTEFDENFRYHLLKYRRVIERRCKGGDVGGGGGGRGEGGDRIQVS